MILKPETVYSVSKIVCIGRNYAAHISEMSAEKTGEPMLFLKPPSALLQEGQLIVRPEYSKELHHEIELALLVGKRAQSISSENWRDYISGAGIALDLTLRDLQKVAKEKGTPWSVCKGFDGSCPVSKFTPLDRVRDVQNLTLELRVNGKTRQSGSTSAMIFPVHILVAYISKIFTLEPGDIILSGTPEGVGPLNSGDTVEACIDDLGEMRFSVA